MRPVRDQQYGQFTPEERTTLTFAALSRGDEKEATRLWQTCPRYDYKCYDLEYTMRVTTIIMIGALFFEKCVGHYNLIKKAEILILSTKQDLKGKNVENQQNFRCQTKPLIALSNKTQELHLSKIKGLFHGFKQFCSTVGLDSETILKTVLLKDCCHDLDAMLETEIELNVQYANKMRSFFLEHWDF